jgi:uncharacterized membrane protein YoaK (UPF0700 family)
MQEDVSTLPQLQLPSNPGDSNACVKELRDASGLLVIACVFAMAGGYMDAYAYLAHGHVFANAQTGNVVLFSVFASGGQWAQAARHLPPIAAFALGVAAAKLLGVRPQKRAFRATLICQALELVTLAVLAIVEARLPDACVVPMISFVAAIQFTSFRSIGSWSFNSAMITSNLREAISGLVLWRVGREATENRDKAIALSLISLFFLLGALCGGIYTRLEEKHALAPCVAIVGAGFLLTWRKREMKIHSLLPPGAVVGTGSSQN